ncbi:MAG: chemotaxis protein CheA, partial [Deltaproteobacteria bacterium]|nr:chemotaxis protein CheA [Deltaproteobacteria bacterium]
LKSITQTVRVDIAKLDSLMNLVGELIITKGSIISIAANMKNQLEGAKFSLELQKPLKSLDKRLTALQEGLMEARMVPLTQIFDKLSRNVRKIGRDINKEVSLEVFGGDTKLDKLIVEELSGPLMHIIRNSMDHGIESAEVREGKGKPAKGVITLNAYQSGGHVLIEVSDDGGGINHEKIFKKAVEKGLVEPGHLPRKEEIINLMFLPGFSTSDEVSDISGRGVGMDVVKESIAAISGMVEIESKEGQGTKVILTLPMTLAIIQALIAEVNGRHFAVPLNTVVESFLLEDTQVETIETKEFVHLRNATIPIIRLSELLDLPENSTEKRDVRCFEKYVVVVGLAEKKLGLVVDDLLGQQDIVIKSVGKRLGSVSAIAGATEYRQKTILTIDVGGIIEECMGEQSGLKSTLSN